MTLMSGKVYSDFGVPSNTIGEQGDIFMQLDGLKITYRKEGVAWTPIGNQLGTIPEFLKGVGVPSNVLGQDNQYYRNVTTQVIYQKNAGVWNNIGSWTSLQVTQVLDQSGVGKDLGTLPNFINSGSLNDVTKVGEYYYSTGVTDYPVGADTGLMKVWRIDANNVGQLVQRTTGTSYSPWHIRLSSGGSWGQWVGCATQDGDSTRKFKALAGVAADDVAVMSQLPEPLNLFGNGYSYLTTGSTLSIPPKGLARIIIIGGGGGGSTYEGASGGNGSDSELTHLGVTVLKAKGGLGAYAGYGVGSGNGDQPAWPQGVIESTGTLLENILTITKNSRELNYLASQGYGAAGLRDPSQDASPNVVRTGHAGSGADIEFLITNLSTTSNLLLAVTVGVGGAAGGGASGAGGAGVIAYRV